MVWLSVIDNSAAQSPFQFGEFLVYIPTAVLAGTGRAVTNQGIPCLYDTIKTMLLRGPSRAQSEGLACLAHIKQ